MSGRHSTLKDCTKSTGCFTSTDFYKYDWKVEINPKKPKNEDEFDVIIIG